MKTTMRFLTLTTSIFALTLLNAGDSDLDPTFGDGGVAQAVVGTTGNLPLTMAVQPDGKVLIGGASRDNQSAGSYGNDLALVRYNGAGQLDTSFDGDGKVVTDIGSNHPVYTDERIGAIVVQPDYKIVVGGTTRSYTKTNNSSFEWYMWDVLLVRYNTDGSIDAGFGSNGKVIIDIMGTGSIPEGLNDLALQSDNKIIGVGYYSGGNNNFLIMRFNTDGSLDTTFGAEGTGYIRQTFSSMALQDAYSVLVLEDDSILVAGRGVQSDGNDTICMLKLTANGQLDSSFNGTGKLTLRVGSESSAQDLALDSSGRFIVSGYANGARSSENQELMILRFNPDGSLDTTFNGTGIFREFQGDYRYQTLSGIAAQDNGKIVGAGAVNYPGSLGVMRVNEDGTPDESFAAGGKRRITIDGASDYLIGGIHLQGDGKLVVGGFMYTTERVFAALRFGGPDPAWDVGHTDMGDGWKALPWFGSYKPMEGEWIWHMEHGFIHVVAGGSANGLFFYTENGYWLWTNDVISPYYYNITEGTWGP